MISLFKRDPVITPFIYQTSCTVCVCVWYSPYIREIYQDNDLSPAIEWTIVIYYTCADVLLCTVGWQALAIYALLDFEKKGK